ncbi:MAG: type I methionyl aminopeptidase [Solirubrobacteraceae bacterium]
MSVDTPEELEGLRRAGRVVAQTLEVVKAAVAPGVTTGELDRIAADYLGDQGARSGPILTYGYPGSICISVDDQVVHGIPGERVLRPGELVKLDVAAELDGYHADAATTVAVGPVNWKKQRLMSATRAALSAGIEAAQPGATLSDVGAAIERATRARGFHVFRELTGHGIGRQMHEEPTVFNWPAPEGSRRLTDGLVITIEPMLTAGRPQIVLDRDRWTVRSVDHSPSCHEEHTLMVADGGPVVLTAAA